MSPRIDRPWVVMSSYQTFDAVHCVDVFSRPDGTFGFEEYRSDPEDMGAWTAIGYHSEHHYPTLPEALKVARERITWLGPLLGQ